MNPPIRLFVFGLGFSAAATVRRIRPHAAWVGGTVRDPDKAERLRAEGIATFVFDGTSPADGVADALAQATHCLVSIPPGDAGDPVLAHHAGDLLAGRGTLGWLAYLSTVGVYGDHGGDWVSEQTPPRPRPGRSQRRLEAEAAWRRLADRCAVPLAVFRIAGIYGPGRNALQSIATGKAQRIVKPDQIFNRIHVDDIAGTLGAAVQQKAEGIFNLADDEPAPPQDVVAFAAGLMGVAPPPEIAFADADLTPMARSFYGDNKRVSNRRIRQELGVILRYPTYRDGLAALWREGRWAADLPDSGR